MGPKRPLRFFASGEYGDRTERPHYHAILFGCSEADADLIETTWGKGHARTYGVTPAAIAYVAGYCDKKIGYRREEGQERVDPDTGEVYTWQPPFTQMSRRPGIGGEARKWRESWRLYAILNGVRMPVPRYLHEAWKESATEEEMEMLMMEKSTIALRRDTITDYQLRAAELIAEKEQELKRSRRRM